MNLLKKTIAQKGSAIGTFLHVSNVQLIEAIASSGLDFVVIDTEHGPYDTETMGDMLIAATHAGMAPLVRVADVTHKEIQRAVDNGAQGIIVPCLRSVDDFKKVVDLAKFAPVGNRGFIIGRGAGFGTEFKEAESFEQFMANSNEKVLVLPQCETKEALESIEEIVAIEGLDGIFIGPFDLSISMGIPGQFQNPVFVEAVDRIMKACKDEGKVCLIFTTDAEGSRDYLTKGAQCVAQGIDSSVFAHAYERMVADIAR